MWITPLITHCVWQRAFPTTVPTPPTTPPTVEPTPVTTPPTIVPTPPNTPPTTPPSPPINPPIGSRSPSPEIVFSSFLSNFLSFS